MYAGGYAGGQRIGQAAIDLYVVSRSLEFFHGVPGVPASRGAAAAMPASATAAAANVVAAATVKLNRFIVVLLGNALAQGLAEISPA